MSSLILIENNEIFTTSKIVAEQLGRQHRNITDLIKDYEDSFNEFGVFRFETGKPTNNEFGVVRFEIGKPTKNSKGGRPEKVYFLNEQHLTFLIMILRVKKDETDKVLGFKKKITKEFFKMRKTLMKLSAQRANQEWLDNRSKSKIVRLDETDEIKKFVEYAKSQGSKSADKYYTNLTTMNNNSLFWVEPKFKNLMDVLDSKQLDEVTQGRRIIMKALVDGMKEEMHYKEIFKLAKHRVGIFAELKGKSVVPAPAIALENNDNDKLE